MEQRTGSESSMWSTPVHNGVPLGINDGTVRSHMSAPPAVTPGTMNQPQVETALSTDLSTASRTSQVRPLTFRAQSASASSTTTAQEEMISLSTKLAAFLLNEMSPEQPRLFVTLPGPTSTVETIAKFMVDELQVNSPQEILEVVLSAPMTRTGCTMSEAIHYYHQMCQTETVHQLPPSSHHLDTISRGVFLLACSFTYECWAQTSQPLPEINRIPLNRWLRFKDAKFASIQEAFGRIQLVSTVRNSPPPCQRTSPVLSTESQANKSTTNSQGYVATSPRLPTQGDIDSRSWAQMPAPTPPSVTGEIHVQHTTGDVHVRAQESDEISALANDSVRSQRTTRSDKKAVSPPVQSAKKSTRSKANSNTTRTWGS